MAVGFLRPARGRAFSRRERSGSIYKESRLGRLVANSGFRGGCRSSWLIENKGFRHRIRRLRRCDYLLEA